MVSERFYGYKHWTLEEVPRCFYIGKGVKGRSHCKRRNHKWHDIVKRLGLRVEICVGPVINEEAIAWEITNIIEMKTFTTNHSHDDTDDVGCNLTRGGECTPRSVEARAKDVEGWSDDRRRAARERMASPSNPMKDPEIALRVTRKLVTYWTGREWSVERRERARLAKLGPKNPNYGKPQPEEAKQKNRDAQLRRYAKKRAQKDVDVNFID